MLPVLGSANRLNRSAGCGKLLLAALVFLACAAAAPSQQQSAGIQIQAPLIEVDVASPAQMTGQMGAGQRQQRRQSGQGGQAGQQGQQGQASQTPPGDMGSISGAVFSVSTGEPLQEAHLTLLPVGPRGGYGPQRISAVTDPGGNYQIANIAPGRYRLMVSRRGYVNQMYGQNRTGGSPQPLDLASGQNLSKIDFRMIHCAVISGRVLDENGEPVERAQVEVLRKSYSEGEMSLAPVGSDNTNDLGQYRVFDLPPGRYYVTVTYSERRPSFQATFISRGPGTYAIAGPRQSAANQDGDGSDYPPEYYPGVRNVSQATPVFVKGGDEASGIDLALTPIQTHSIRGRLADASDCGSGRRRGGGAVLIYATGEGNRSTMRSAPLDSETGAFEIDGVIPGSYTLAATCGGRPASQIPVQVGDSDVEGISLVMSPGAEISGTVKLDGQVAAAATNVRIWLSANNAFIGMGGRPTTEVDEDGSFDFDRVGDGKYSLRISSSCGQCYLKSAQAGNTDLLTDGLQVTGGVAPHSIDVVYSSDAGVVTGTVKASGDDPAPNARVVLVPDAPYRHSDRYRTTFSDSAGKYELDGVPPGNYEAYAWELIDDGEYEDPGVLQQFQKQSQPIEVEANQAKTQDLTVIPASDTGGLQ